MADSAGRRGERGAQGSRRAAAEDPAARGSRSNPRSHRGEDRDRRRNPSHDRGRGVEASEHGGGTGRPRRPGAAFPGRTADGGRPGPRQRTGGNETRPHRSPAPSGRSADLRAEAPRKRGETEPRLPDTVDMAVLDREVRAQLRPLSKPNAEAVAGHLIEAARHLDDDPQRALAHARAARARAARVGAVREAVGIAAYRAGEWAEALAELRAARRITGGAHNLAVIADCERGLGRPEQAARALHDPAVAKLDPESRAELLIVVAGARRDLGQVEAALAVLARGGLDTDRPRPGSLRLWYAYADALEELGRREEAARWFAAAAGLDVEGETDAVDRAAALL